jgi:hypothetical protein
MIPENDVIALFQAPTVAMKAERLLRKADLNCRLIPAPREVAAGCSMALRCPAALFSAIMKELTRLQLPPRAMYRKVGAGYQPIAPCAAGEDHDPVPG